jgi:U3 small nucleolar RNA-associated protein 12
MGIASAGDSVKLWDFDLVQDTNYSEVSKRLSLKLSREIKTEEEVLSLSISNDGQYICASLLDMTVKVFHLDSLKFYLSLYGHKLPVNSISISDDNCLLISGSADKNIKIWGMDFGDCRKSIFAHDAPIMAVSFVPKTHYFFSAGRDRLIKYWDADKFELILTLNGHLGDVFALAISSLGEFLVTGSQDRSIRVWERTDEQVFVETERELQMDNQFEESLLVDDEFRSRNDQIERSKEAVRPTKKTMESIRAGENLIEAIEMALREKAKMFEYSLELSDVEASATQKELARSREIGRPLVAPPPADPVLIALNLTPEQYVLKTLTGIRSAELEEVCLFFFPFFFLPSVFR